MKRTKINKKKWPGLAHLKKMIFVYTGLPSFPVPNLDFYAQKSVLGYSLDYRQRSLRDSVNYGFVITTEFGLKSKPINWVDVINYGKWP